MAMSQFVIPRRFRRGKQNDLTLQDVPGSPFDLAQDRELVERRVEPRVSLNPPTRYSVELAWNDSFVELRHRLRVPGLTSVPQGLMEGGCAPL